AGCLRLLLCVGQLPSMLDTVTPEPLFVPVEHLLDTQPAAAEENGLGRQVRRVIREIPMESRFGELPDPLLDGMEVDMAELVEVFRCRGKQDRVGVPAQIGNGGSRQL